uniref:Calcineurin-like phosphoesterase superfamily domain-containing protein n=1 Tax=Candidatus Kentrum sp. LFY TaxID=2126342 RepID=A0A450UR42_9GAMM|nr:MAG: Calcineurin-like phosphoesterase superfamily domain-containing protein [Candidatus Kentron sp. LFY]
MLAAKAQLDIAIPSAILAIFVLLMIHFGRMDRTLMVMLQCPIHRFCRLVESIVVSNSFGRSSILLIRPCKLAAILRRAEGTMLLLHISDIHFRAPDCTTPDLDPERPFRIHLLRDARNRIATLGPVGAILVTGDIAYKADPVEYDTAFRWLEELANLCECPLERVYVVPGNHDLARLRLRPMNHNPALVNSC